MLLAASLQELRDQLFPRTQVAALVSTLSDFRECFASVAWMAEQIGRSPRQVFRYLRWLKEQGLVDRVPGSRDWDVMPKDADRPEALRAHGFARTHFRGWLASFVAQHRSIANEWRERRDRKRDKSRERRDRVQRERLREQSREAAQWREQYAPVGARAERLERLEEPNRPDDPRSYAPQVAPVACENPFGRRPGTGPPE
jgi:hypothetical protein